MYSDCMSLGLIQGLINYKENGQLIFVWHWHCIPEDLMVHLQLLEPKYKLIKVLKTSKSRDLASTERVLFSTYTCDFLPLEMAWAGCFSTTVSFSFSPSVLHPFAQSTEKVQRMNIKTVVLTVVLILQQGRRFLWFHWHIAHVSSRNLEMFLWKRPLILLNWSKE